jgi:hypothetical protein
MMHSRIALFNYTGGCDFARIARERSDRLGGGPTILAAS